MSLCVLVDHWKISENHLSSLYPEYSGIYVVKTRRTIEHLKYRCKHEPCSVCSYKGTKATHTLSGLCSKTPKWGSALGQLTTHGTCHSTSLQNKQDCKLLVKQKNRIAWRKDVPHNIHVHCISWKYCLASNDAYWLSYREQAVMVFAGNYPWMMYFSFVLCDDKFLVPSPWLGYSGVILQHILTFYGQNKIKYLYILSSFANIDS
jgi:hypothetical protein